MKPERLKSPTIKGEKMNLIFLLCFGTIDYRSLPEREFWTGAACVNRISRCERTGYNRGMSVATAREACIMAEKNFRNERE